MGRSCIDSAVGIAVFVTSLSRILLASNNAADRPGATASPGARAATTATVLKPNETAPEESTKAAATTPAESAYDRALLAYEQGDKVGALTAMQESYRLSRQPDLIYNIAKIERELGRCGDALKSYRTYQRLVPGGPFAALSATAVDELKQTCQTAAVQLPPEPAMRSSSRAPSYWTAPHVVAWATIAAGVGVGAGALFLQGAARSNAADAQHLAASPGKTFDDVARASDRARTDQTVALAMGTVAGALLAGGITCLVLAPIRTERAPSKILLVVRPSGASLGYAYQF